LALNVKLVNFSETGWTHGLARQGSVDSLVLTGPKMTTGKFRVELSPVRRIHAGTFCNVRASMAWLIFSFIQLPSILSPFLGNAWVASVLTSSDD